MLKSMLLVFLGGGIGSMLRYLTSEITAKYYAQLFPLGTFSVNIIGCFIIGLLIGVLGQGVQVNQNLKLLFITGFCGGYTTFSTFASENVFLLQNKSYLTASIYIGLSILAGLIAVWFGLKIAR